MFPGTDDEPKVGGVPRQAAILTEVLATVPAAMPAATPAAGAAHNNPRAQIPAFQFPPPPAVEVPIAVIELSDSQSGINNVGVAGEEEEVQGGGEEGGQGVNDGSIVERVMGRRRANFAHFGDVF